VTPNVVRPGAWTWLFPVTMIVHVAEEAATGETFPVWISRVAWVHLTLVEFLAFNAIAFAVVALGTVLARRLRDGAWAVAALATAVGTNVVFHVAGTFLTGSISPGVYSAVLLWLPLSALALVWTARHASRRDLALGIAVGFAAHALVTLSLVFA
jgi:hypothetical protein